MSKVRKNLTGERSPSRPLGLTEVLRVLPERELELLVGRLGILIDPAKRIDVASQVARALVSLPDLRELSPFPPPARELLHRIAEARGTPFVPLLPPAVHPFVLHGIVFS